MNTGNRIAARMAIMAITTSSSMSVKPFVLLNWSSALIERPPAYGEGGVRDLEAELRILLRIPVPLQYTAWIVFDVPIGECVDSAVAVSAGDVPDDEPLYVRGLLRVVPHLI